MTSKLVPFEVQFYYDELYGTVGRFVDDQGRIFQFQNHGNGNLGCLQIFENGSYKALQNSTVQVWHNKVTLYRFQGDNYIRTPFAIEQQRYEQNVAKHQHHHHNHREHPATQQTIFVTKPDHTAHKDQVETDLHKINEISDTLLKKIIEKFAEPTEEMQHIHSDVEKTLKKLEKLQQSFLETSLQDIQKATTDDLDKIHIKQNEIKDSLMEKIEALQEISKLSNATQNQSSETSKEHYNNILEKISYLKNTFEEKQEEEKKKRDEEKQERRILKEQEKQLKREEKEKKQERNILSHNEKLDQILDKLKEKESTKASSSSHSLFKKSMKVSPEKIEEFLKAERKGDAKKGMQKIEHTFETNIRRAESNLDRLDGLFKAKVKLLALSKRFNQRKSKKIAKEYNKLKKSKIFGDFKDVLPAISDDDDDNDD